MNFVDLTITALTFIQGQWWSIRLRDEKIKIDHIIWLFFFSSCPTLTECIVCKCDNDERAVADMFRILCIPSIRPHHRSCSCPNANRRNPNDSVAGARCPDHWTPPSNGTWSAGIPPCWTAQRERVPKHCETHKQTQSIYYSLTCINQMHRPYCINIPMELVTHLFCIVCMMIHRVTT